MNQEITELLVKQLISQPFVSVSFLTSQFSESSIRLFSKQLLHTPYLLNDNIDLVCSIAIQRQASVLIQYQKWSHISQGFILYESANFEQKIQFKKQDVKELKIVGFLQKLYPFSELKRIFLPPVFKKKRSYLNKQVLAMKAKVQRRVTTDSLKKMQIQSQKPKTQRPKVLQKITQKPENINTKPRQQELRLKPLQKKSSRDIEQPKPLNPVKRLLNSKTPDEVMQGKQINTRALKMNIESDEEFYDKNTFSKIMEVENEKGKETDCSGKKKEDEDNEQLQQNKQLPATFIVDDDDEDGDLFAKMDLAEKKQPPSKLQSHTQQKACKKPTASQPPKVQAQSKKQPIASSVQSKGLMGWLKK